MKMVTKTLAAFVFTFMLAGTANAQPARQPPKTPPQLPVPGQAKPEFDTLKPDGPTGPTGPTGPAPRRLERDPGADRTRPFGFRSTIL